MFYVSNVEAFIENPDSGIPAQDRPGIMNRASADSDAGKLFSTQAKTVFGNEEWAKAFLDSLSSPDQIEIGAKEIADRQKAAK